MDIGQVKTKYKAIKFLMIENFKVKSFRELIPNILPGTVYNIITQIRVNPYTFLLDAIDKYKTIEELYIVTYRISEKAMNNIKYMIDNNLIKNTTLLVNDNYETLMKDKAQVLINMNNDLDNFTLIKKNSHAKITLIKVKDKHIVISGSGNYSANPKIEQYQMIDNKELYNFHKEWIEESKGRL